MEIKQLIAQAIKEAIDKAYPGVDTGLDYEALLDHLADALFDYDALNAAGELRQFAIRGGKLFFTDAAGADLGCVDFTLTENGLTLDYGDTVEEYKKA